MRPRCRPCRRSAPGGCPAENVAGANMSPWSRRGRVGARGRSKLIFVPAADGMERCARFALALKVGSAAVATLQLDKLAGRPDAPVIICEGEKSAEAAAVIFPKSVAVTAPGGANAADKADWSVLRGRKI